MFGNKESAERTAEFAALEDANRVQQETIDALRAAYEQSQSTVTLQAGTLASNRKNLNLLTDEIRRRKIASDIGDYALAQLIAVEESGETYLSATLMAQKIVTDRLIEQTTAMHTNDLLADEEDRQREEFGPDKSEAIRKRLDETFKGNGTYDQVGVQIELDEKRRIKAELISQKRAEIQADLNQPARQATMSAEAEAEIEEDGTIEKMRASLHNAAYAQALSEAIVLAKDKIMAELASQSDAMLTEAAEAWIHSRKGIDFKKSETKKIRQEVTAAGSLEAAKQLKDEITVRILEALNERTKKEILKDLVEDFDTIGTDITKISADNLVTIHLSNIADEEPVKFFDPRIGGTTRTYYDRKIELRSIGYGEYVLEYDSCINSDSPSDLISRISPGDIVHFGDVTDGAATSKQSPFVTKGIPLTMTLNGEHAFVLPGVAMSIGINKTISSAKGLTERPYTADERDDHKVRSLHFDDTPDFN